MATKKAQSEKAETTEAPEQVKRERKPRAATRIGSMFMDRAKTEAGTFAAELHTLVQMAVISAIDKLVAQHGIENRAVLNGAAMDLIESATATSEKYKGALNKVAEEIADAMVAKAIGSIQQ